MQRNEKNHASRSIRVILSLVAVLAAIAIGLKLVGGKLPSLARLSGGHESSTATTTVTAQAPAVPVLAPATAPSAPIMKPLSTPDGVLSVEVSSSEAARERGLSGRTSLPTDSGMLFVFPEDGVYGFWMKDMKFPLDIVWIGSDKSVLGVVAAARPDSYPRIFYPPSAVRYVLELGSGAAAGHSISVGSKLSF